MRTEQGLNELNPSIGSPFYGSQGFAMSESCSRKSNPTNGTKMKRH
jgi:hypothetical protein